MIHGLCATLCVQCVRMDFTSPFDLAEPGDFEMLTTL
jgi:hypothetical protein